MLGCLWAAQACLTMAFLGSGYAKLTEPMELLVTLLDWPALVDGRVVRLSGLIEMVLAASFMGTFTIEPCGGRLLGNSARAVVALTLIAMVYHGVGREVGLTLYNILLLGLALVVLHLRRE